MANPAGIDLTGPFVQSATSPYTDPLTAYATWAVDLGLDPLATQPFGFTNTDDGMTVIDLGFSPIFGSTATKLMVSSEGGVGLYYDVPTNLTVTGPVSITAGWPGQQPITRFYTTVTVPAVIISGKNPTLDAGIFEQKWNKTTTAAILYCKWSAFGSVTTDPVQFAIKFTYKNMEVSVRAPTTGNNRYFQVFYFQNSYVATADPNFVVQLLSVDTTYHYTASVNTYGISGIVRNELAQPVTRTVRAYDRVTGQLTASTTSDPVTGAFSCVSRSSNLHQVVALDDDAGTQYNDIIISRVAPILIP